MTRRINKRPEGSSQTKVINFDERGGEEKAGRRSGLDDWGCFGQFIFVSFEEAFKANFADERD